ncbi:hypothetical protein J8273_2223 [Carpediemonas membranifera]|uniref:Uncharacterized protein n=1 Tax=Carpediemonas membranifera TaxID=201153 RepID=A0A8J6EB07_9EUKA|nr:hypothetical protein J8273_2223 [Carpediemonas membranifera]|eukprot:KAG9395890.1 hypothetical protein J8273_2223 [Carpediemonas membranifera]
MPSTPRNPEPRDDDGNPELRHAAVNGFHRPQDEVDLRRMPEQRVPEQNMEENMAENGMQHEDDSYVTWRDFRAFQDEVRGQFAEVHGQFAEVHGQFAEVHGDIRQLNTTIEELPGRILAMIHNRD